MAKKKFSNQSSRLIAEQDSLRRQEQELRRREALLKQRLQRLPAAMKKIRRSQAEQHPKAIYTTFAETSRPSGKLSLNKEKPRHLRGPSLREKRAAKIKFIILVLILSSLLISIWRSLPG